VNSVVSKVIRRREGASYLGEGAYRQRTSSVGWLVLCEVVRVDIW
jgi:hypothetical protein